MQTPLQLWDQAVHGEMVLCRCRCFSLRRNDIVLRPQAIQLLQQEQQGPQAQDAQAVQLSSPVVQHPETEAAGFQGRRGFWGLSLHRQAGFIIP